MSKAKEPRAFDFGISTHPGLVRQDNQDCSAEFECINGHVFIVCDGMGGHAGGAVASNTAVESIRAYLENHYFDMPEDALKAAIEFANSVVYRKSKEKPEYHGMGTTIVMAMIRFDKVHYAHVGDSRVYIFSDGRLHRLTRDHSKVQELVDKGLLSEQEARIHPERNILTRALGLGANIEIEFCTSPVIPALNDFVMLCTDGFYAALDDAEISAVLMENTGVQEKADKLIQRANEKGGADNATVQLIYFNNVSSKKAKFVALFQLPKELRPVIKEKEQAVAEPVTEKMPEPEEPVEEIQQEEEPVHEPGPKTVNQLYEKEQQEEQAEEHAEPVINTEPVIKNEPVKKPEPVKQTEPVTETGGYEREEKSSFLDRFGFYRKLKENPDLKSKIRIAVIIIGVVFIAFVFWDLFIKQSATTKISDNSVSAADTLKKDGKDTATTQTQVEAKPDTVWISYSVKKGEFLGTIATKFGVKIDYIKAKNKLTNDNIREKQKLDIPTKANHLVKSGESLDLIAKKYQVDKKRILKANDISEEKSIKADKSLIIPFK